jgi:hypothetical protein
LASIIVFVDFSKWKQLVLTSMLIDFLVCNETKKQRQKEKKVNSVCNNSVIIKMVL